MNRRTFVAGAGLALAGVAGCLGAPADGRPGGTDDGSDDDGSDAGNETDRGNGEGSDGDPSKPDDLRFTIDLEDAPLTDGNEYAELEVDLVDPYVGADSPAEIEATVSNASDEAIEVASGAPSPFGVVWLDDPDGSSEPVTLWSDAYEDSDYVGTDGLHVEGVDDIGLSENVASDESVSRTFELHAETPHLAAGTYGGEIGCGVAPADGDGSEEGPLAVEFVVSVADESGADGPDDPVPEKPRVDEPPYPIERPETPDDPPNGEWNDHYLGEEMPAEPSLPFERLRGVRLERRKVSIHEEDGQYAVRTVESEADLESAVNLAETDPDARGRLEATDFDEELIVIVESGFGSGSVSHRWKRVEDVDDGVHLHGYYTQPYVRTDDYTSWASALVVERPDDIELARVSLTVDEDRRVHFNSTEGVVPVEE